jgi:hypothetical protein
MLEDGGRCGAKRPLSEHGKCPCDAAGKTFATRGDPVKARRRRKQFWYSCGAWLGDGRGVHYGVISRIARFGCFRLEEEGVFW